MMEAKLTQLESKLDALLAQFEEAAGDAPGSPDDEKSDPGELKDEEKEKKRA